MCGVLKELTERVFERAIEVGLARGPAALPLGSANRLALSPRGFRRRRGGMADTVRLKRTAYGHAGSNPAAGTDLTWFIDLSAEPLRICVRLRAMFLVNEAGLARQGLLSWRV